MHWYQCEKDHSQTGRSVYVLLLCTHEVMSGIPRLVSSPQFDRQRETGETAVLGAHVVGVEQQES